MLQAWPRFQGEAFYHNLQLAEEVRRIAKEIGATAAQVALGWIKSISGKSGLPVIIPIPGATTLERVEENVRPAQLTDAHVAAINDLLSKFKPAGQRYPAMFVADLNG